MLSLVFHRWWWIWLVIFSLMSSGCWWNCSVIILCSRSQSLCPTWWIINCGRLSWRYFNRLERSVMMIIRLVTKFMIWRMRWIDMNTRCFAKRWCPRSVYIRKCSVCIWMMTTGSHANSWSKWRRICRRWTELFMDIFRSLNLRRLHFNGYCGS